MGTNSKNSIRLVLASLSLLVLIGLAVSAAVHPPLWLRNIVPGPQGAAVALVNLASSTNFAILAGASVVDANLSVIVGDVGLYPASGSFNAMSCAEVTGNTYSSDAAGPVPCSVSSGPLLTQAKTDLTAAYTAAANETPATTLPGSDNQLGSQVLTPGIYTFSGAATANLIGTVTLDGQGDPNAVFVFQTSSSLVTDSASVVHLINGAQSCHVFWQVGSSATLGTGTTFAGTIMADQSITDNGGSTVDGRLLASSAAVTLNNTHVTVPTCTSPTGTLHVIKSVINTNAGTATSSDFTLHIKNSSLADVDVSGNPGSGLPGVPPLGRVYTLSPGVYTVSEDLPDPLLYTQNFFGADCVGGSVTVVAGQDKVCTIINTDIQPPAVPSGGGGGSSPAPLIKVIKIPNPLALPAGPGSVTYTYTATNIGPVSMLGVWVKDDKCSPVTFVSGDTNNDAKLDIGEQWVYSCTALVTQTVTNTATAHGQAGGQDAYAVALATVVVGAPIPPPLINITKVPSRLTPFPFGGGPVTYTYTVTNPGIVALHDVTVTDDKCAPVSGLSGDTNGDNLLDPGETWKYTCSINVPVSTRNVATAKGTANGLIALGYAFAVVLVSAPGLPNTGIPPQGENAPLASPTIIPPSHNFIDDKLLAALDGIDLGAQVRGESPVHLKIPDIKVDSDLEAVRLTSQGAVGAPEVPTNAAWFNPGTAPGEIGSAVIVGHFGWKNGIPAVFDDLNKLHKGDKMYVENKKGETLTFVVREIRTYGENKDVSSVFSSSDGKAHLNLITCGGEWNAATKSYSDRVVVFADEEL